METHFFFFFFFNFFQLRPGTAYCRMQHPFVFNALELGNMAAQKLVKIPIVRFEQPSVLGADDVGRSVAGNAVAGLYPDRAALVHTAFKKVQSRPDIVRQVAIEHAVHGSRGIPSWTLENLGLLFKQGRVETFQCPFVFRP